MSDVVYQPDRVLDIAMEIGVNLLKCGAEISRVENTISYICKAYGATDIDVFAIPTLIVATIVINGNAYTSKVKRNYTVSTDLYRLEKFNKLSRFICSERPSLESVKEKAKEIEEMKDYIKTHMAKHKVPKYIDFVEQFPMNAAGKILKFKMREDAAKKLGIEQIDGIVTKE